MSSPPPPQPDAPLPLPLPPLPADLQVEILSRVGNAVSVVRCAATCKAWRCLIQEPSFILLYRRRGPGGFDPSSLIGFFFRDTSQRLPRRRLYRRRPTRFLLLGPSQSRPSSPVVLPLSRFLATAGDLNGFVPVASSGGGLVAHCRTLGTSRDTARICVCNPLAGTSTFLPPLPPLFVPEKIIFLEAGGSSFRLLTVMNDDQGVLVLRIFSSQTGWWDAAVAAELPDNMVMIVSSPAVVHRGAVHWICGTRALPNAVHTVAVRLTQAGASVSRIDLPPHAGLHRLTEASRAVRLANSMQDTLSLVLVNELVLSIWNLEESIPNGKQWSCCKAIHLMPMLPPINFSCRKVELSIQGLCEKSGSLFLHLVGEGLFMFNVETKKLVKVCKAHFDNYLCPYVADIGSCLAAMKKF